jgi:hypothetical protein
MRTATTVIILIAGLGISFYFLRESVFADMSLTNAKNQDARTAEDISRKWRLVGELESKPFHLQLAMGVSVLATAGLAWLTYFRWMNDPDGTQAQMVSQPAFSDPVMIQASIIPLDSDRETSCEIDLAFANEYPNLRTTFLNRGCREFRAVGESRFALLTLALLLNQCNYRPGSWTKAESAKLFHEGDICFPEQAPFIFICPLGANGERVDLVVGQFEKRRPRCRKPEAIYSSSAIPSTSGSFRASGSSLAKIE